MTKQENHLIGRRFTYLSKIGTWCYGTILSVNPDGNYVARLDCQKDDETWLIHPSSIGHKYFLTPRSSKGH